jgi:hypothetical protein
MEGACGTYGGEDTSYSILVVKYEGRYLFGDLGVNGDMKCNWV